METIIIICCVIWFVSFIFANPYENVENPKNVWVFLLLICLPVVNTIFCLRNLYKHIKNKRQ